MCINTKQPYLFHIIDITYYVFSKQCSVPLISWPLHSVSRCNKDIWTFQPLQILMLCIKMRCFHSFVYHAQERLCHLQVQCHGSHINKLSYCISENLLYFSGSQILPSVYENEYWNFIRRWMKKQLQMCANVPDSYIIISSWICFSNNRKHTLRSRWGADWLSKQDAVPREG